MNRTKFYDKVEVDGVEQLDFLRNSISKLVVKSTPGYYRLDSIDRKRPDITSYRNYGTVNYWWIWCVVSGIEDPFFDTQIGVVATIPSFVDIQDFAKKYKLR